MSERLICGVSNTELLEKILEAVVAVSGLERGDILGRERSNELWMWRTIAHGVAGMEVTQKEAGEFFGRHFTAIGQAILRLDNLVRTDKSIARKVRAVIRETNS